MLQMPEIYGHGKTNSHHEPNCLKCAGNHLTSDCKLEDVPINYKCFNCNGNHKANDQSYLVLINNIKNKNKASAKFEAAKDVHNSEKNVKRITNDDETKSYAAMVKKHNTCQCNRDRIVPDRCRLQDSCTGPHVTDSVSESANTIVKCLLRTFGRDRTLQ